MNGIPLPTDTDRDAGPPARAWQPRMMAVRVAWTLRLRAGDLRRDALLASDRAVARHRIRKQ
jgi:hypothetical protein